MRLIIFDFDGVLGDTAEDLADAANMVLVAYGRPPVPVERVRQLLPDADDRLVAEATSLFQSAYSRCYDQHTHLYPGVAQTLKSLLAAGMLMAVATNKAEAIAVDLTQKLGIDSCFAVVVGAESVTHHKPDPEALRLILGRLGVKSGCALMVGDTAADILAGKRARTMTCAALYGYGTRSEVEAAEPDFSVFPSRRSLG